MELNAILLWVECVIHLATFLLVFFYRDHHARQRWGVSAFAIGIAGSNVGLAVLIVLGAITPGPTLAHALLILTFGCILGLLLHSRGNVAKMIQPCKPRTPA